MSGRNNLGPYLPLYVDDFLGGTIHFGADEVGAYLLLLSYQWSCGEIEDDPVVIERVSRCSYDRLRRVLDKFDSKDGYIFNRRLEAIRRERVAFVKSRSKNASNGWKTRRERDASADAGADASAYATGDATDVHTESIPSPSPSPLPIPVEGGASAATSDVKIIIKRFKEIRPEFARVPDESIARALQYGPKDCWESAISDFERDIVGALECPTIPHKLFAGYVKRAAGGGKQSQVAEKKVSKFT